MKDEYAFANAISEGRSGAARAVFAAIKGEWAVLAPMDVDATTFLTTQFYMLDDENRSIFREALRALFEEYGRGSIDWTAEELSAALYVAREISLLRRFPMEMARILRHAIQSQVGKSSLDAERLLLKYLAVDGLVTRTDVWRDLHAITGGRHTYTCFVGMAASNSAVALLWVYQHGTPSDIELVLHYWIPASVREQGGSRDLRAAIHSIASKLPEDAVSALSSGVAAAIERDPYYREIIAQSVVNEESQLHAPNMTDLPRGIDWDQALLELTERWDSASNLGQLPARVQSILAADGDDEEF